MRRFLIQISIVLCLLACSDCRYQQVTSDDGHWFVLEAEDLAAQAQHVHHAELFGKHVVGYNYYVLQGVDHIQSTAMDGGGYFIGKDSIPTESPIGYELKLFGRSLLNPPRRTSYCSGSSYAAFIEGLNLILSGKGNKLSEDRHESLRMQELDGGRREDHIKFWGKWNADGYGNHFALVQYSGMGKRIKPVQARPGDFMNISWKNGLGHSVVFLGWYLDEQGKKNVVYWASQRGTNGLGDQVVALDRIKEVVVIRLIYPDRLFSFDPLNPVNSAVPGDSINW